MSQENEFRVAWVDDDAGRPVWFGCAPAHGFYLEAGWELVKRPIQRKPANPAPSPDSMGYCHGCALPPQRCVQGPNCPQPDPDKKTETV